MSDAGRRNPLRSLEVDLARAGGRPEPMGADTDADDGASAPHWSRQARDEGGRFQTFAPTPAAKPARPAPGRLGGSVPPSAVTPTGSPFVGRQRARLEADPILGDKYKAGDRGGTGRRDEAIRRLRAGEDPDVVDMDTGWFAGSRGQPVPSELLTVVPTRKGDRVLTDEAINLFGKSDKDNPVRMPLLDAMRSPELAAGVKTAPGSDVEFKREQYLDHKFGSERRKDGGTRSIPLEGPTGVYNPDGSMLGEPDIKVSAPSTKSLAAGLVHETGHMAVEPYRDRIFTGPEFPAVPARPTGTAHVLAAARLAILKDRIANGEFSHLPRHEVNEMLGKAEGEAAELMEHFRYMNSDEEMLMRRMEEANRQGYGLRDRPAIGQINAFSDRMSMPEMPLDPHQVRRVEDYAREVERRPLEVPSWVDMDRALYAAGVLSADRVRKR